MAHAFMNIKNVIHHNGILHDNLLKDNIMLHFLFNNPYVLYIDMCNWGEVRCLQEVISSLYGLSKEQDAINTRKLCWWVNPLLFFVCGELKTTNSLWCMAINTKQL
jgi:hypothetical protein